MRKGITSFVLMVLLVLAMSMVVIASDTYDQNTATNVRYFDDYHAYTISSLAELNEWSIKNYSNPYLINFLREQIEAGYSPEIFSVPVEPDGLQRSGGGILHFTIVGRETTTMRMTVFMDKKEALARIC